MYIRLFKIITVLHISKYFPIYYIDYDIIYRVIFFSNAYDFPLTVCLGNDVSGIKLVMLSFFSPHFEKSCNCILLYELDIFNTKYSS